ncbi:hypothetical protein K0M31_019340 [Melipona bicolor]|uniref:Uncharacterized protein n=1 Tax=Melipona bicolor TaxID=60889 RepID=A0AA40G279_9HYME|nr:hypothetical protein K0M31_019340 [Melipona bicolor]
MTDDVTPASFDFSAIRDHLTPRRPNSEFLESLAKICSYIFIHRTLQICPPATTGFLLTSKRCSRERNLAQTKEVDAETETYFESKDKSFYKKGMEKLEERWNECITFEEEYVNE